MPATRFHRATVAVAGVLAIAAGIYMARDLWPSQSTGAVLAFAAVAWVVLGAGGVFTEILSDSVSLLPPWTRASIESALQRLTIGKLLAGYRGKPAADVDALITTILSVARYAADNLASLVELDVNPVIVRPAGLGAVAVDTMIRLREFPEGVLT